MPAPLSLRIKERYMAKRANGLSQQVAADAAGISVRSAQRIDRGELQPEGQQQQRGRHWRTRADPLAEVWESVLVPMLEKAPQLEPQTLCQATSKTEPLPTLKTEPPPNRSEASFPEWFRLGCAGGASACSWFSDWLRWLSSVIDAGGAVAVVFPSGLLGWHRWRYAADASQGGAARRRAK